MVEGMRGTSHIRWNPNGLLPNFTDQDYKALEFPACLMGTAVSALGMYFSVLWSPISATST
jgi:hypothetical protein